MEAPPSNLHRVFAGIALVECAYLLVPWQAVTYGHFAFELNQDLLIWAGAPLAWLTARALWTGRTALAAVMLGATWCWLVMGVLGNFGPHGFGMRTDSFLSWVAWVPPLNTGLVLVLALLGPGRQQATATAVAAR